MKIGIISDTHGLLRPEAVQALQGVDRILHAGDVGTSAVLEDLQAIAPVIAVRGNVDRGEFGDSLPVSATLTLLETKIHLLHIRQDLAVDPVAEGIRLVIFGHSHKPFFEEINGVIYLNPGAAGRRRFSLPITLALITLSPSSLSIDLIDLLSGGSTRLL